jgi:hypothetical protein
MVFLRSTPLIRHPFTVSDFFDEESRRTVFHVVCQLILKRTKTPLGPVASISSSGVDQQSMMNTVLDKMKRLDLLHGTFFFEQHPLSFLNNNMNLDIDENEKELSTISPIQQEIIDSDDDESINIEREIWL